MVVRNLKLTLFAAMIASLGLVACGDDDDDDDTGTDTTGDTSSTGDDDDATGTDDDDATDDDDDATDDDDDATDDDDDATDDDDDATDDDDDATDDDDDATDDDDDATDDDDDDAPTATVYALHGSTDAPEVDVFVGDTEIISGLAFGEFTGALTAPAGVDVTLDFFAAAEGTERPAGEPAASVEIGQLEEGKTYVAIATGFLAPTGDQPEFTVLAYTTDDIPAAGDPTTETSVVAIHAGAGVPEVDLSLVTAENTLLPLIVGLGFGEDSRDSAIPDLAAGNYQLTIGLTEANKPAFLTGLAAAGGVKAFAVAIGGLPDDNDATNDLALRAILVTPAGLAAQPLPVNPVEKAKVTILHGSPDAPAVDGWIGTTKAFGELNFSGTTATLEIDPFSGFDLDLFASVIFKPSNEAIPTETRPEGDPAATVAVPAVASGSEWVVVAAGFLGEKPETAASFQAIFVPVNFGAFTAGKTKLTVVHAGADIAPVDLYSSANDPILGTVFTKIAALSDLAFGEILPASGAIELNAVDTTLGLGLTGQTSPAFTFDAPLATAADGIGVVAVAIGALSNTTATVIALLYDEETGTWTTAELPLEGYEP